MPLIYIGADHGGFQLKQRLLVELKKKYEVVDFGALEEREDDDYNEVAMSVAKAVRKGREALGILICGSGLGMAIQANRLTGVRAIGGYSKILAKMGREHNNANILCLAGRCENFPNEGSEISFEELVEKTKEIVEVFLETKFSFEERHARRNYRLDKVEEC